MSALRWITVAALLAGGCGASRAARETALLRDARQCEEDADEHLRSLGQTDLTIRMLSFQSCMMLRGWQGH